jgi:succinate dehydrogenase / fumarate reductase membrane anchor subunit
MVLRTAPQERERPSAVGGAPTPYKKVERLGAAKEGTSHFWRQRVTAVAGLLLLPPFVWLVAALAGADYDTARRTLSNPIVGVLLLLVIAVSIEHMRIGMQVIIEDYVHGEGSKIALLLLNTFFSYALGLASVLAVLKLSFGG